MTYQKNVRFSELKFFFSMRSIRLSTVDHSSSTYGNLIPDPTPKRRKGSGTHQVLSGAC